MIKLILRAYNIRQLIIFLFISSILNQQCLGNPTPEQTAEHLTYVSNPSTQDTTLAQIALVCDVEILLKIVEHPLVSIETLSSIVSNAVPITNAIILKAIANHRLLNHQISHVPPKKLADLLFSIVAHRNIDPETLELVANHPDVDLTILFKIAGNNKANAETLLTIVRHQLLRQGSPYGVIPPSYILLLIADHENNNETILNEVENNPFFTEEIREIVRERRIELNRELIQEPGEPTTQNPLYQNGTPLADDPINADGTERRIRNHVDLGTATQEHAHFTTLASPAISNNTEGRQAIRPNLVQARHLAPSVSQGCGSCVIQ
jgi:hypothetical protein